MAGDEFTIVNSGDRLKIGAAVWSDLLNVRQAWRAGRLGSASGAVAPFGGTTTCLMKNNSGQDVAQYGVLGIDNSLIIDPSANKGAFLDRVILAGVSPIAAAGHRCNFAIALEPIRGSKIGTAAIAGVVPVQVSVTNDTLGIMWADIQDGDVTKLRAVPGGFRIFAIQQNTGPVWALVELGRREGPRKATMQAGAGGSHPLNAIVQYDLAENNPDGGIAVINEIADVTGAAGLTAYVEAFEGMYRLIDINACGT